MKTFDEFITNQINESKSIKRYTSGAAATKLNGLKNKIHSTNDLSKKVDLLAEMIAVQSTLFFARDLFGRS